MKSVSTLKPTKTESPKTPGGISKSLLTPCRRVGLSRNWKKAGPSPFVSPLSSSNPSSVEIKIEKKEPKKRKKRSESDEKAEIVEEKCSSRSTNVDVDENDISECTTTKPDDISNTPTRHIEVPRKKKSKTLLAALNTDLFTKENDCIALKEFEESVPSTNNSKENVDTENVATEIQNVSIPVRKSKSKKSISPKTHPKTARDKSKCDSSDVTDINQELGEAKTEIKSKSPNELTKECIVVIQKKIFKTDRKNNKKKEKEALKSQVLFDSDTDDVPLCQFNKEKVVEVPSTKEEKIIDLTEEEDFIESKRSKIKRLEDKATSIGGLKKVKLSVNKTKKSSVIPPEPVIKDSFDDEDDFDFTNKKTILIRKTYEKVNRLQKAKSTGSITQKDIDDLKARIEAKKKLLLAKAMTKDTDELRSLIKKWQKGCQDALMELMDLMKNKFPDKQNMEYSEMLAMLKIPTNLVGYDEDNDCFITPDDKDLILSNFQNM